MNDVSRSQTKKYLTPADIAMLLEISERTVDRWVRAGKLRAFRMKNVTRVAREDFETFLSQNTSADNDEHGG